LNEPWWERHVILFLFTGLVKDKKDRWIGNYWDTLTGIGSKKILGAIFFGLVISAEFGLGFVIPIPWVAYDRLPARNPYEIP